MGRSIILLRGINLGPTNRIAMPALREALEGQDYENVATYVQSGNIVLDSAAAPDALAEQVRELIAERFDLEIPVVARTRDELARVVQSNPFEDLATDPKRYQVTFLSGDLSDAVTEKLNQLAAEPERVAIIGREVYAWHPNGVARSKLWNNLASRTGLGSGVIGTSRNWTTVNTLLAMANGD
ncbi:MAG TPA: DUF1697 domain-containing protein [Solirubrobacteraceae bacterium]|nr:DUF1697 domain-containing protein [Solirubrobacteraceae bacterium]